MIQYSRQEQLRSTDTSRNYSAVSYAWGLPDFSVDLVIDQSSIREDIITPKQSLLRITPTVDSILRYLRDPHKSLYLWIDALCIDQRDENDKAVQIPQMGEIYRCAETVHVWLGDVDADEVAIAFVNIRMAHAFSAATESSKTDLCKSLMMLTQKPWFTRRWVIQEIKLADRAVLHYGKHSIEYARFRTAWYLVESRMISQDSLGHLRLLLKHDVTEDLLELLWGFHTAKCSDPRDRLAALYGFLPQSEQPIDLQYDQLDWKEMYRRLAERSINEGTVSASRVILHLSAFGPVAGRSLDDAEYPSWVPDWTGVRQRGMASGEFHMDCQFSTDRADKPWAEFSNEIGVLETEGPSSDPHLDDNLSGREKEMPWFQEARQDIPSACHLSNPITFESGHATRFSAGQKKLRVRWSPIRGGLYGRSARLILTLPQELVVEKDMLWKHVLSCLDPIKDNFVGPESWFRATGLFAIILGSMDVVSEEKDYLSRWPLEMLMGKLYEAFRAGFENLESLTGEQILLLTLIGSILQRFALVVLHPLPYLGNSTIQYNSIRLEPEYGLAPHDMELGDILIPFDEKQQGFKIRNYRSTGPGSVDRDFMYEEEHVVEVSICLRPMSPKLVHKASDNFQDELSLPSDKIAAMTDDSQETYRDRPDDPEFLYPPSYVRTARFLGPAYCMSKSHGGILNIGQYSTVYEPDYWVREEIWNDYGHAWGAGLCRPLNIDIV
ncbi:HET domain-containing protein [Colletotrichum nymphaeae SA-01]|uniref:HET domain-containing protein n=1 Tax=Colletotrichum nymphaeae SA-01 TaxID=1460502 RepID=A0A135UL05_9PEZI|nr:HET domain-containing protein [Colletotrichum nymphaeae SA-01]